VSDIPISPLQENEYETQSPLLDKTEIVVTSVSASEDIEKQEPISRKRSQQLLRIVSTGSVSARKRKASVISNISSMDFTGSTCQIHMVINVTCYDYMITCMISKKMAC
jgi:hypothetical protein